MTSEYITYVLENKFTNNFCVFDFSHLILEAVDLCFLNALQYWNKEKQ